MEVSHLDYVVTVLDLFDRLDMQWDLEWSTDRPALRVQFSVRCNDVFFWGCSDCEDITPDNLPGIEAALADVRDVLGDDPALRFDVAGTALILWASRVRGMRPQGAAYPADRRLWPLFNACGPERETGLGNPHRPGEREGMK